MADISKLVLPDNTELDIKDSTARSAASSAAAALLTKVNISQGLANAGKILGIGVDGKVTPVDPPSGGGGDGDVTGPDSSVGDHIAIFSGTTGKVIQDSGFTIGTSVPSNAVFTDTTYENKSASSGGTDVSLVTTGEKYIWNNKTDNVGTVTGVKMNNGSAINPDANGIVNLGTVLTQHQDISGKADIDLIPTKVSDLQNDSGFLIEHQDGTAIVTKINTGSSSISASKVDLSGVKGVANGLAELDATGKVPSTQLPSYVDDVIEYSSSSAFPLTGETEKIYVALDTNKTYRWSGSDYVEISASLALGETSSTAYRGDRGKTAYDHATDSSRLTTAQTSGLYKIATTAEGHIASVTAVQKSDITALDIPAQDTTYESKSASSGGTDVSLVTTGEKYTWNNKLDNNQGSTNAGKFMQVGQNGELAPETLSDATQSAHGLMSTADKTKLDGVETGAEENDVFVAVYGTTTYDEVAAALQEGKAVVATNSTRTMFMPLFSTYTSAHYFTAVRYNTSEARCYMWYLSSTNEWNGAGSGSMTLGFASDQYSCVAAADSWSSTTPPTQTISVMGVSASNNIIVSIDSTATSEQYEAAAAAKLLCTAQGINSITLTCYGTEPTENIPISVLIVG